MKTTVKILLLACVLSLPLLVKAQVNYTLSTNGAVITASVASSPNASGNVVIETYAGYPVSSIEDFAFYNCSGLTGVTIGNNVTYIGNYTFSGCYNLASVTINPGANAIGIHTFYGCSSLTSVTIPNSVTSIGVAAFYSCSGLPTITIPNSVTNIDVNALGGCAGLTNIAVAASNPVYSSANGVLFNQTQTTLIGFPAGLGGSYTIPDRVTSIGDSAFYSCSSLMNVTMPNSLIIIGTNAFTSCTSLTNVTLGNSVANIEDEAFSSCSSLPRITMPDSVTNIGGDAYYGCSGLTSLTIPNRVINIGDYAFIFCAGLTNVTIGSSVVNVGIDAFSDCNALQQAFFLGNAPLVDGRLGSSDSSVFSSFGTESGTVYYYAGTSGWGSTFGGWPTAQIFARPQIYGANVSTNKFGFTITGASNQVVTVVASTNLTSWQPIWTNTLSSTSTNFTDAQWKNYPRRFYRAY
jgi:hypothetical protein